MRCAVVNFIPVINAIVYSHRFAKTDPRQVVLRVSPGLSICCRVFSGSPGESLLRFQFRPFLRMKPGSGTGSFCPIGTVLE